MTRIQWTPRDPALKYELGMISLRAGDGKEGVRWMESALAEDPNYAPTHRALARYYQQTGQSARAARHRRLAEQAAAGKQAPAAS